MDIFPNQSTHNQPRKRRRKREAETRNKAFAPIVARFFRIIPNNTIYTEVSLCLIYLPPKGKQKASP